MQTYVEELRERIAEKDKELAATSAEREKLRDLVCVCRRSMRELDVEGHCEQSWDDFCKETVMLIEAAAGGKETK